MTKWHKAKMELEPSRCGFHESIEPMPKGYFKKDGTPTAKYMKEFERMQAMYMHPKVDLHRMKAPWYKEIWLSIQEWYIWNIRYNLFSFCPLCGSDTYGWGDKDFCTNEKCKYFKEQI